MGELNLWVSKQTKEKERLMRESGLKRTSGYVFLLFHNVKDILEFKRLLV